MPTAYRVVDGDLLRTEADVIVNPWNRNTIPWWLLLPQGVSGAIRQQAGMQPFKELRKRGRMALGAAVATSAGELPYKGIIHVAGINDFWKASEKSIRFSVRNAVSLATTRGWTKLAMPLIGAGTGGLDPGNTEHIICNELERIDSKVVVT